MQKTYTFDRVIKILITLAIIVGLYLIINSISGALLPFLIAWLIAYMMNPLVNFVQHKMRVTNRSASILLSFILVIGTLIGISALLIPQISEEATKLQEIIATQFAGKDFLSSLGIDPQNWPHRWKSLIVNFNPSEIINYYFSEEEIKTFIQKLSPKLWSIFSSSMSLLVGIFGSFIVLLYIFFILLDFDTISNGAIHLIPEKYRQTTQQILNDLECAMNRYFRGQALVATLVGILFAIGFVIIGLPMGIALGLFIGLLNMVPYLQIIGVVPTALLCLIKAAETGQSFLWIFILAMLVFGVVQLIQDTIIVPKVMGKVTGMNPAIILLSLSVWGSLLGMIGMIIALPITTLLISYYQRFILKERTTATQASCEKIKKTPSE